MEHCGHGNAPILLKGLSDESKSEGIVSVAGIAALLASPAMAKQKRSEKAASGPERHARPSRPRG